MLGIVARDISHEADKSLNSLGSLVDTERRELDGRLQTVFKNIWPSLRAYWLWVTAKHSDKTLVVFEDQRYTYQDILSRSVKCAAVLRELYGVEKGDRIIICASNCPSYPVVWWACHLIGAVAVPVSTSLMIPLERFKHCVNRTSPKVIFVDPERATLIEQGSVGLSATIVVFECNEAKSSWKDMMTFEQEMAQYRGDANQLLRDDPGITLNDNAAILFTSGTTGVSKCVLSSQRILLSSILTFISNMGREFLTRGEKFVVTPEFMATSRAVLLTTSHCGIVGLSMAMSVIFIGMKIVMMRNWDAKEAARLIAMEEVTTWFAPPWAILDLADVIAPCGGALLTANITSIGGPMSASINSRVRSQLPNVILKQRYGSTETTGQIAAFGRDFELRPTSVGQPLHEVVIVQDGVAVLPGTPGEIWVRGPTIMKGYWGDQDATDKVLTKDGWFKTGDLGYVDEEGFLYIQDRIKDIIVRGSNKIASVTVENALYQEPGVLEAAAVAVPDERLGELAAALVTLKPGYKGTITEKQLLTLARKSLPPYAFPVMVMIQDGQFERTSSGKILKSKLKDIARTEWMNRATRAA